MFSNYWKRFATVGGALALMALGASPVAASTGTCPSNTPAYFTGTTVYLGQVTLGQPVWSSQVTLHAYCGSDTSANWLSGVSLTGVYASSNGSIPSLEASADGVNYTMLPVQSSPGVPYPTVLLSMPTGLVTDSQGNVVFTLYVQSTDPQYTFLANTDYSPQLIGMQLDTGTGTGVTAGGSSFPLYLGGFGGVYASTPELDSLALFGTGALGLVGFTMMRFRARRRTVEDSATEEVEV